MKSGKTLTQLAQELERQSTTKKDFLANTSALEMTPAGELALEGDTTHEFPITEHAHAQIAARLDIPAKYYNRMRAEAPALLATNVNEWFHSKPERRMVRTLDGKMRAFLSDRYRRLDNYDLAEAVLPILAEMGEGIRIVSTELTDSIMYIKAINSRLELEVNPLRGNSKFKIHAFKIKDNQWGLGPATDCRPLNEIQWGPVPRIS